MALSKFAGTFNANDFAYGIVSTAGTALSVSAGTSSTGAQTLTLESPQSTLADGSYWLPLSTVAPITIGAGSNAETVTPTAVSQGQPQTPYTATVTATFANGHGIGDPIVSGSVGLQEAINYASNVEGGGIVVVNAKWAFFGGTTAMLQAAVLPTAGNVVIEDRRNPGIVQYWTNVSTGAAIAAPSAATSATVASQTGVVGTWTAATTHVVFSYVDALGGETLTSADYSFTATVSLAIGGSGPAAATGAVGYRVYLGSTAYLAPVTAANGTVIQCGPIAAFAIGTPFSIATATTSALATIPLVGTAFSGTQPGPSLVSPQPFRMTYQPLANIGAISAAATGTVGMVQIPAGWLNYIGRTIRIKGNIAATTNSTAGTLTVALNLWSVYGVTDITPFTAISGTTTGSAVVSCDFSIVMTTVVTGTSGKVECHGQVQYSLAGTAVATTSMDFIHTSSSTIDLTKQDCLEITVTCATTATTATTLRQLVIEPIF